jgi:putative endonuclease
MHHLYILYSKSADRYYIGETHDLAARIILHNSHAYEGSFSKIASDWKVVLDFETENRTEALSLEKFIKKMKSKKFILKIIANPEILLDILSK